MPDTSPVPTLTADELPVWDRFAAATLIGVANNDAYDTWTVAAQHVGWAADAMILERRRRTQERSDP